MNQAKTPVVGGRGTPVDDPVLIRRVLKELRLSEAEFPIRVEGAHTLPYTSHLHAIDAEQGEVRLKLIRPLPHELPRGALFVMLFSVGDQRFEAPLTFLGRDAYLLYSFTLPGRLIQTDRRHHKRYPFRPRENAYVMAQDASIPGYGFAGTLVNLCLGGLAFRVDRAMRLDDHLRVSAGLGFFERGKALPALKIRDLPRLPVFEARGQVSHAYERFNEVIVGVQFGDLRSGELAQLQEVLDLRDRLARSPAGSGAPPREILNAGGTSPDLVQKVGSRVNPAGVQTPDALLRLGRRCLGVVLAMPPGPERDGVCQSLGEAGYLRLTVLDSLHPALHHLREDRDASQRLLLAALEGDLAHPLTEIRTLLSQLGNLHEVPVGLFVPQDARPALEGDPAIRALASPRDGDEGWLAQVDALAQG